MSNITGNLTQIYEVFTTKIFLECYERKMVEKVWVALYTGSRVGRFYRWKNEQTTWDKQHSLHMLNRMNCVIDKR